MKLRTKVVIELEYDPDNSATIDQLCRAIKEGIYVDFNTDHCRLIDAHSSIYDTEMVCPECGEWVCKRPGKYEPSTYGSYQHKEACKHYEEYVNVE